MRFLPIFHCIECIVWNAISFFVFRADNFYVQEALQCSVDFITRIYLAISTF